MVSCQVIFNIKVPLVVFLQIVTFVLVIPFVIVDVPGECVQPSWDPDKYATQLCHGVVDYNYFRPNGVTDGM